MNRPTCALVLTTIFDPVLLEGYLTNFMTYHHLDQVKVFVIPDRKTPTVVYDRCRSLKKRGLDVKCPTLDEQEEYLQRFGKFTQLVPFDSDNRRNIGFLMALESGADFLISIDDDNFCRDEDDFFEQHSIVCQDIQTFKAVHSPTGWFNICSMLDMKPSYHVFPRGFPYHKRHQDVALSYTEEQGLVRINVGLWLSEPDLDAITWLVAPVKAVSFCSEPLVLGAKTWSPINTQNTALHRDVIPSYYFVRMGYPLAGIPIDRYGDIFSGYFSQACARHFGHRIRIGKPLSIHRRNSHNYLRDATNELACIWVLEDLTEWLPEANIEGTTYEEAYVSLSYAIEDVVEHFRGFIWTDATRGYFHQMAYCMREWVKACQTITGG